MGRKVIDLSGQRFGRLVVGALAPSDSAGAKWSVHCDCGNEFIATSGDLRRGHTTSCGCFRVQKMKLQRHAARYSVRGEYLKHTVLKSYQINSKKRGYSWGLSDAQFFDLISLPCHYCGAPPSNLKRQKIYSLKYGGLDRKDNTAGYTEENVVPCCKVCNFCKKAMTYDEFIDYLNRISSFRANL
jgi:hypothetical protein